MSKVTIFNRSGRARVFLYGGKPYRVPAGEAPGAGETRGASGNLVVPREVAEAMVRAEPEAFAITTEEYSPAEFAALEALPRESLAAACRLLMRGVRVDFVALVEEAQKVSPKMPAGPAVPAAGKAKAA